MRRARLLGPGAPISTEHNHRTDLTANNATAVMTMGGVMLPEDWAAAKAQQQANTNDD